MTDERPRGILTESDRVLLRKTVEERLEDYSSSARTQRRQAIQERVRNAILDFTLLWNGWEEEEREEVFSPSEESQQEFYEGLEDLLAMIYAEQSVAVPSFKSLLEGGVTKAETRFAGSDDIDVDVDFGVDITAPRDLNLEETGKLIDQGKFDKISERDLRVYMKHYRRSGELDPYAPHQHLKEQMDDYSEKYSEQLERRQKERREKQARKLDRDEE